MKSIDRIKYATQLSIGKKVLDIGGKKAPNCDPKSPFAREYAKIARGAKEYRIVDCQHEPEVDYVMDLNIPESISVLRGVIDDYKPEIILCMETLEHINYHFECLNQMAYAVSTYRSSVFITVPNNANWVFNIVLGWNYDHSIAFFKSIAERFIGRSDLGRHHIEVMGCMQTYLWYWWIAYAMAFFQPFSWGFLIRPKDE